MPSKLDALDKIARMCGFYAPEKVQQEPDEIEKIIYSICHGKEAAQDFAAARGCLREIGLAMPGWYSPEKQEHGGKLEIVIVKQ